ncbi:NACHT domain-containing protein [Kordia sp. YSTF-M3]|uniref:NACHT domain-containing protein n=1 Tax=Kordia aestuariivivens TaxID=2759037 RepID=A0ABR7Q3P3_9FLAO|nr:NACHT domain-containing protein [Kordia aestuariivivens]MBC8753176.1 NACHT domain-containing protein [Kordia aestuariivivens]
MLDIIYEKLITTGIKLINQEIKRSDFSPKYSPKELQKAIFKHTTYIKNETKLISYRKTKKSKKISDVYIDIDISVKPRSESVYGASREKFIINEIIKHKEEELEFGQLTHIILMGGPGAGKTTTVGRICRRFLGEEHSFEFKLPILIKLRDIPQELTIYGKLVDILGLEFYSKDKTSIFKDKMLSRKIVNAYLNSLNAILVIDGLDEVEPKKLSFYNEEIKDLFNYLDNTLVILTSRSASLNYSFPNSEKYELCDLSDDQVVQFVNNWFSEEKHEAQNFLSSFKESQFYIHNLKIQPLTLAHICGMFEFTGKLYDKPRNLYKRLLKLLIEDWDANRQIKERSLYFERKQQNTQYSKFETDDKIKFLSHFAFDLSVKYATRSYTTEEFEESYLRIYENHNLPRNQCEKVVKEIEAHNGIIIKSSIDTFLFYHKVIQEILAAKHITGLKKVPINKISHSNISNELAIAVCIASDSTDWYIDFIFNELGKMNLTTTFVSEFLTRLIDEQPIFKRTKVIPLSFIYIYDLLLSKGVIKMYDRTEHEVFRDLNTQEFNKKFNEIIRKAKTNNTIYNCFLNFDRFFQANYISGGRLCKVSIKADAYEAFILNEQEDYINFDDIEAMFPLLITRDLYKEYFEK